MPFSASPEPEGDWLSSSPSSGQRHWGTSCTTGGWITSEDQAFIKDAEQMLKIIKDSLLGIKSMYSTLLSSSCFLFSLWYPSAVYIHSGICSDFMNTTAHFPYPVLALVAFLFSPDWSWKGLGSSLKFPVLQPRQDVRGMEAEAPTQSQKPQGEDTMPLPCTSSCSAAQWELDTPAICFSARAQVFWSQQNIGHSKNLEIRKWLEIHIQRFPVYSQMSHN